MGFTPKGGWSTAGGRQLPSVHTVLQLKEEFIETAGTKPAVPMWTGRLVEDVNAIKPGNPPIVKTLTWQ
jgi:hypothetical protein